MSDLVGCGSCYENYEVYVSQAVDIKAEWRCFIYYDNILDVRQYGANILTKNNESWKYHYDYKVLVLYSCLKNFYKGQKLKISGLFNN